MLSALRLGWRNGWPTWNGDNAAGLSRNFAELQRFMTWPHFTGTVAGGTAVTGVFSAKTVVADEDPYGLIRSTGVIQVPQDFDSWWFMGQASAQLAAAGAGMYQIGFTLNGVNVDHMIEDQYSTGVVAQRVSVSVMQPVSDADVLRVAMATPAASTVVTSTAVGLFLPMA